MNQPKFTTMNTSVERSSLTEDWMLEMWPNEAHHDHEIELDDDGTPRWKENPGVQKYVQKLDLNDLWMLMGELGLTKNSELVRHLYRCKGYSLFGYWELFYWEVNNPDAAKYVPPKR